MEPPWDGGTKVRSTGPGHMTKIAAMPICGKNLKKSVCVYVCVSTFSNISSSETTVPIKVKFHMEPPWDGELKFVQLFQVTWPRLLPCPCMVKTLKNLLLRNQKADDIETWYTALSTTKFVQMMTLGWPWPILWQGQIWSFMHLYGKKVKQWIFQKLLSSVMSKLVDAVN